MGSGKVPSDNGAGEREGRREGDALRSAVTSFQRAVHLRMRFHGQGRCRRCLSRGGPYFMGPIAKLVRQCRRSDPIVVVPGCQLSRPRSRLISKTLAQNRRGTQCAAYARRTALCLPAASGRGVALASRTCSATEIARSRSLPHWLSIWMPHQTPLCFRNPFSAQLNGGISAPPSYFAKTAKEYERAKMARVKE